MYIYVCCVRCVGDGSEADNLLLEKEREEDKGSEEAYQWLFDAVSGKQGQKYSLESRLEDFNQFIRVVIRRRAIR